MLIEAIEAAGRTPGEEIALALDPAATELYRDGRYVLAGEDRTLDSDELVAYWADVCDRYPIVSIEDGMAEEDWDGWAALTDGARRHASSSSATTCSSRTSSRIERGIDARRRQRDAHQAQPDRHAHRDARRRRPRHRRRLPRPSSPTARARRRTRRSPTSPSRPAAGRSRRALPPAPTASPSTTACCASRPSSERRPPSRARRPSRAEFAARTSGTGSDGEHGDPQPGGDVRRPAARRRDRADRQDRQGTRGASVVRRVANREQTEALLRRRTHRARLGLLVAVIAAGTFVGLEFPIGELMHQRAEISLTASQLRALTAADRSLAGQVTSLRSASGIEHVAHAQYGLVYPGQTAYVVLPFSGDSDLGDPLAEHPIPASDIAPAAPTAVAGAGRGTAAGRAGEGLWQRVVARLEFWRWAF